MSSTTMSKTRTERSEVDYGAFTHTEHVHNKPEFYIGDSEIMDRTMQVYNLEAKTISTKTVKTAPGFIHLFLEICTNAFDNILNSRKHESLSVKDFKNLSSARSPPVKIVVTKSRVTITNAGTPIPVAIHSETLKKTGKSKYVPEIIFGQFFSGHGANQHMTG